MNKPYAFLLVFLALSALLVFAVQPVKASGDLWVERAPMPNQEYFTYMLNPSTDSWVTKTPMPTNQQGFAIAVYQNEIYVIGGWNSIDPNTGVAIPTGSNEMYDPATDTWTTKSPMPTPTTYLQANVVDDKIYLISGMTNVYNPTLSNATWVYDPATDSWSTAAPIPTSVFSYASAVVNNQIYIEGGELSGSPHYSNLNQIYDPETNTWTLGQPLPVTVYDAGAGATTGVFAPAMLYVMGGTNDGIDGINTTQIYNPQTDNWTLGAQMLTARLGLAVAVLNDSLYAIGGESWEPEINYGAIYNVNEQYIPLDYQGPTPSPYVPTPSPYHTSTPTPTSSPSPTLTPSESPSASPSASPQPTRSPEPISQLTLPIMYAAVATVATVIIAAAVVFIFRKSGKKRLT
jgi:N-acetylneuraminic acid mutarotase